MQPVKLLFLLVLLVCPAFSQFALVSGQHASFATSTGVTSIDIAFPGSNTVGNMIAVQTYFFPGTDTSVVTDTQGNHYIAALSPIGDGSGLGATVWYATGIKAGANTVHITNTGSPSYTAGGVAEFSGSQNTIIDKTGQQNGVPSGGGTWDSGFVTTAKNGELILGTSNFDGSGSMIISGSGYTEIENIDGTNWEYQIQSTAGSIAATFSATTPPPHYYAWILTFYNPPSGHHSRGSF